MIPLQVPPKPIDPGDVFWLTSISLGVAVAITVLVWTWFQIRAWCWDGDDPAADAGAFLTSLRESAREGDVSDEEFRSIQCRLASRIEGSVSTRAEKPQTEETIPPPEPATAETNGETRSVSGEDTA